MYIYTLYIYIYVYIYVCIYMFIYIIYICLYSGLARGPRVAETWVRLPASAVFLFVPLPPFTMLPLRSVGRSNGVMVCADKI